METLTSFASLATTDFTLGWQFVVMQDEIVDAPGVYISTCTIENIPLDQWFSVSPCAAFFEVFIPFVEWFRSCQPRMELLCLVPPIEEAERVIVKSFFPLRVIQEWWNIVLVAVLMLAPPIGQTYISVQHHFFVRFISARVRYLPLVLI